MVNEDVFKDWFNDLDDGMMEDAVDEGGGGDLAFFGFVGEETVMSFGIVAVLGEAFSQREEVFFQIILKTTEMFLVAFAFSGFVIGGQQVG